MNDVCVINIAHSKSVRKKGKSSASRSKDFAVVREIFRALIGCRPCRSAIWDMAQALHDGEREEKQYAASENSEKDPTYPVSNGPLLKITANSWIRGTPGRNARCKADGSTLCDGSVVRHREPSFTGGSRFDQRADDGADPEMR